jgi:predicted nuclease with TOPRIM domain
MYTFKLKKSLENTRNENTKLKQENVSLQAQISAGSSLVLGEVEELKAENNKLKAEIEKLTALVSASNKTNEELQKSLDKLNGTIWVCYNYLTYTRFQHICIHVSLIR